VEGGDTRGQEEVRDVHPTAVRSSDLTQHALGIASSSRQIVTLAGNETDRYARISRISRDARITRDASFPRQALRPCKNPRLRGTQIGWRLAILSSRECG